MLPISICIITKNEAEKLEKCLKALRPYPFEIIVTDTGSTDNSKEIAFQYADKVIDFTWINDFSAARNFCASQASYDMILPMDTDEYVTEIDLDSLTDVMNKNPKGVGEILRFDYFESNGAKHVQEVRVTRLYNRKYYTYTKPIHENIVPKNNISFYTYHIPVLVDHDGYLGSQESLDAKALRDIQILERELEKDPSDPYLYFQIGQSYLIMRQEQKALEYLRKAIVHNPPVNNDYTRILIKNYGEILLTEDCLDEAESVLRYYDAYQTNADYLCLVGKLYIQRNEPLKALPELIKALTAQEYDSPESKKEIPSYFIGHIYQCYGQNEIAIQHFRNCGNYPPAIERLKMLGV